jgi:hypothetical protein
MYLIPLKADFSGAGYQFDFEVLAGMYFGLLLVGGERGVSGVHGGQSRRFDAGATCRIFLFR